MDVSIFHPSMPALREAVACMYFMQHAPGEHRSYRSFPSVMTNLSFVRGASIAADRDNIVLTGDDRMKEATLLRQNLLQPCNVSYQGPVAECTVFFHPLGIHHFPALYHRISEADAFISLPPDGEPFAQFFREWKEGAEPLLLQQALEQWLIRLYQPASEPLLSRAIRSFDTSPMPSTQDLAKQLGVSRQTLYLQFQSRLGISPAQFRKVLRFRKTAGWLVEHPEKETLTGLAYAMEFADQSHMIRDFRQMTGVVPGEYFRRIERPFQGLIQWMPA